MSGAAPISVRQTHANLWTLHAGGYWVVDPTNAFVKGDGRNVMGAGVSKQAAQRFAGLAAWYGARLLADVRPGRAAGETVLASDLRLPGLVVNDEHRIILALVKHNWWEKASAGLIEASLRAIGDWLATHPDAKVALPRMGCGNGGLDWERDVRPLYATWLRSLPVDVRDRVLLTAPRP